MARTVASKSSSLSTSASNKRKSSGSTDQPAKKPRSTLDAFFSTVVSSSVKKEESGKHDVALSPEQIAVLRMVVDEGKNVFFTGSAGAWFAVRIDRTGALNALHQERGRVSC
jgi:type IV secretory pathway ATPase VirB11/archaellum biosynthesis ATPase